MYHLKISRCENSADHRESLHIVCKCLQDNHPNHFVTKVIETLAEIQDILYLQDSARSPQNILQYINTSFRHTMLLTLYFAGGLKKLRERKFFGFYYHSLICHAPLHFRIFCGRTFDTEKEEATQQIKNINKFDCKLPL